MKKIFYPAFLIAITTFLIGCGSDQVPAGLRGYNHMRRLDIEYFTVNGAMGPNVGAENGGKETCCVTIPRRWRPGLKTKISWSYDKMDRDPLPLPPPQTVEVELPKYEKPGAVQVHFFENHKIKIVISNCSPDHPFYPMSAVDLAPWVPFTTKEEMIEATRRGGGTVEC